MEIFEQNKSMILEALAKGDFDYMECASEVFEGDFFRYIQAQKILSKLAETYPSPRQKEEVPIWFYVAADLSMRLHGVRAFNSFPMLVRAGGMLDAFFPKLGRKVSDPDTGDITVACEGFNKKNSFFRQCPCDQDFLRKIAHDTDADALMNWFCKDVTGVFRSMGAFDKDGIFIGDGSYLFVPDNPRYEGSVKLLFDESGHPVSKKKFKAMSDDKKLKCQWRRCYKMVTLLHTNPTLDFFIMVAVKVVPGNAHECPILYELVNQFVASVGKGVMKRLIVDRGFLDGKAISTCKTRHGIDVLIPVRRNMDICEDAEALFQLPDIEWKHDEPPVTEAKQPNRSKPEAIVKREKKRRQTLERQKEQKPSPKPEEVLVDRQAAAIGDFRSWSSCTVPLSVVANREIYQDGHEQLWFLLDTKKVDDPCKTRQEYHLRTATEERYRQLKCFSDLSKFTSRAFSMVANQVVFVFLAYSLLQIYLLRQKRKDLNKKTLPGIRQQLLPADNHIIVYHESYYGLFGPLEFAQIIVTLDEQARKKIADKCQRLRRELKGWISNSRPP